MDIKKQISTAVEQLTKDDTLRKQFETNPAKALEKILGIDLPDEAVNQIIAGIKAELTADKIKDAVGAFKKLF